jgi:HlyD family secretion protein
MQLPLFGKVSTRKPVPWLVGLAAAGLVGTAATTAWVIRNPMPKQDIASLTVPVEAKTVTARITASGDVVPIRTVNLSPKNPGRLVELLVEQGDRVQQGQVIARMENQELQAQQAQSLANLAQSEARLQEAQARLDELQSSSRVEEVGQARAALELAEARVQEAQIRLELATERAQRNRILADQGAISRDRFSEFLNEERAARAGLEQAQAQLTQSREQLNQRGQVGSEAQVAQAEAQVNAAQAQIDAARGQLKEIETRLDDTVIRAPFAGIITQKYANEGAFVTPTTTASSTTSATSTSIVALANGLEVRARVPEVDIGQIRPNQAVEIRVDAFPDQVFQGKVRLIAPEAVVEQNVTFFQVRIEMVTGQDKVRSGMNADMTFLGKQLNNALIVPTVAIVTDRGQTGVLVPGANNKPKFQSVTIGPTIGNQTQILDGIQAGELVFVELPEGQKLDDITKGIGKTEE